jgi:hypothetical protein
MEYVMPKCFVVVEQYQFPISAPYEEGHVMTATEATVLNWHRARLVQKLVTRMVMMEINASDNDLLSVGELDALQARIAAFDEAYELDFKREPRISVLEYHLEMLATDLLKRAGHEEPTEEQIERVKRAPQIQEKARDRIRAGIFSFEELLS